MVTAKRRLEAIEGSLTPTQCVLRWLNEAHAYGSLEAYVNGTLDEPPDDFPANRLCREAERGARRAITSRDPEQINRAIRKALREVMFRFELILRINVTAHELLDKDVLVRAATTSLIALLAGEVRQPRRDAAHDDTVRQLAQKMVAWADHLGAVGLARDMAERRYLDSCEALFPDVREAWAEQLRETREVAVMAFRLAELDGVDLPPAEELQEKMESRAQIALVDLVEPAKVIALDKLGEGRAAIRMATSWYRAKAEHYEAETESDPASPAATL